MKATLKASFFQPSRHIPSLLNEEVVALYPSPCFNNNNAGTDIIHTIHHHMKSPIYTITFFEIARIHVFIYAFIYILHILYYVIYAAELLNFVLYYLSIHLQWCGS